MRWKLKPPFFRSGEMSYILGEGADAFSINTDADGYFETDGLPAPLLGIVASMAPVAPTSRTPIEILHAVVKRIWRRVRIA